MVDKSQICGSWGDDDDDEKCTQAKSCRETDIGGYYSLFHSFSPPFTHSCKNIFMLFIFNETCFSMFFYS